MAVVSGSSDILSLLASAGSNLLIVNVNKSANPFSVKPPNWTVDQVAIKLNQLGINKDDCRLLARQDVDGEVLAYLTDDSLIKMGITTFGRRVKLMKAAQQLLAPYQSVPNNDNNNNSTIRSNSTLSSTARPSSAIASSSSASNRRLIRDGSDDDDDTDIGGSARFSNNRPSNDRLSSTAPLAGNSSSSYARTDDDSEVDSDTEIEREYHHPKQIKAESASAIRSSGPPGDDDDLFAAGDVAKASEFMAVKPWLGAIVAPSNPPRNNPTPPDRHLRLEWAYGYRAFDSRTNLVYNTVGDIIYPVAGICVVYNSKSKRQKHFMGHNDDVRCLAQHPLNMNLIASGQNATIVQGKSAAPYICVWDSTDFTKNIVLKMTQADRAVRTVGFTGDGKYLASVSNDDNHSVKIWDWEKKALITTAKGDNNPIMQIRGNHKDPREIVTVGKRHAVFWTFDGVKLTGKRAQLGSKDLTFYSVAFSEKGYACLGAEDGGIYVFVGGKPAKVFPNIHKGKVLTLDWYAGGIVSGGSDNTVNILDKKMDSAKKFNFSNKICSVHIEGDNLLVGTQGAEVFEIRDYPNTDIEDDKKLEPITRGHSDGELWGLAVTPDGKYFVTAGEDNLVCIWEVATHRLIKRGIISDKRGKAPKVKKASTTSTHPTNQCARAVAISPNGKHIIVGCNSGEVVVLDSRNMSRLLSIDLNKYGKRQVNDQVGNWIQTISYSVSGHTVAVGTHGSVVVLLDVTDGYKPKGALKASNSFLSHIDWSMDGHNIQTNDGSYELLFYNIDESDLKGSTQNTNATSLRDTKWASQNCILNWSVQGIFDPSQDGTDVNTVDASPSRQLIVTGDDNGSVNLFRYPALKGNKSTGHKAHSSHVVTTRFTADERYVLSTGGHDLSVMQWAIV